MFIFTVVLCALAVITFLYQLRAYFQIEEPETETETELETETEVPELVLAV
jgi:cell division protein FtsL